MQVRGRHTDLHTCRQRPQTGTVGAGNARSENTSPFKGSPVRVRASALRKPAAHVPLRAASVRLAGGAEDVLRNLVARPPTGALTVIVDLPGAGLGVEHERLGDRFVTFADLGVGVGPVARAAEAVGVELRGATAVVSAAARPSVSAALSQPAAAESESPSEPQPARTAAQPTTARNPSARPFDTSAQYPTQTSLLTTTAG